MARRSVADGSGTTVISTALSMLIGEVPEMADHVSPLSADIRKVSYWKPLDAVGVVFRLRPT
jgi:hypothetical protein